MLEKISQLKLSFFLQGMGAGAGFGSTDGSGAGYGGRGGRGPSTQQTGSPYGDFKLPLVFGSGGGGPGAMGGAGGGFLQLDIEKALVVEGNVYAAFSYTRMFSLTNFICLCR